MPEMYLWYNYLTLKGGSLDESTDVGPGVYTSPGHFVY